MRTKISVVMPVYNMEKYLTEALDSVVNQKLDDMEILCVNDGSKDESLAILKSYAEKDPRVQIISQKNAGYGAAVNRGLDAATGEYIAVVEPDDYIRQDMFWVLYEKASETGAEVVKSDYLTFAGEGEERRFHYIQIAPSREYYGKLYDAVETPAMFYLHPTTWTGIYHREFLEKYHIRHNESPGAAFQDNGFWFQVFSYARKVYVINEDFYRYRIDNESSSIHSSTGSFRIFDEYHFIREFLEKHPEIKKRLLYIYSFFRFDNYLARYYQTAHEHRKEFAIRFAKEFVQADSAKEVEWKLFTPVFRYYLEAIVKDPVAFVEEEREPFPEIVWKEVLQRPGTEELIENSFLPETGTRIEKNLCI